MANFIKGINIPLNRAEGDLEINVDVTDGVVTDVWSCGTMYRGFEEMMAGRGVLDGLVITPRICGICSLSHLTAAVGALDVITGISLPDNAIFLCNLALMAETIQSDMRQAILMYMVDFANPLAYNHYLLFEDAFKRYAPMKGSSVQEVLKETKRLIEVIAIIGGQWPHTSFMVPGGVTSIPEIHKILQCRMITESFIKWYEKRVLGCSIERWNAIKSLNELYQWLEESKEHSESEVGFFLRFAMKAELDRVGKGTENFISFGNLKMPESTTVKAASGQLFSPGFARGTTITPFDPARISEDISHSWYHHPSQVADTNKGYRANDKGLRTDALRSSNEKGFSLTDEVKPSPEGSVHPFYGTTKPYASGNSGAKYSWTKAPRYEGLPAETGPLAEMIVDKVPLFHDIVEKKGASAMVRELARMVRPAKLLPVMAIWFEELMKNCKAPFYTSIKEIPDGEGAGLLQAARGALGHWVSVENGKISHYQIITPTAWNGSPRDCNNIRGPWEEALIGTALKNPDNPIEAGHVVRSFDPCMVCAVHTLKRRL